jgi:Rrf2 family protein
MKLSRGVLYAVQMLVDLAGLGQNALCPAHVVARAYSLREQFLLKTLLRLVHAGLLQSVKGPRGGFRLARPLQDITLLDVVEAVEGPIWGEAPAVYANGEDGIDARLQTVCAQVAEQVRLRLRKVRLSDLAGDDT